MEEGILELNSEEMKNFLGEGITVIDFWAEWCAPCKMMGPIFKEVADELKGRARFGKVDIESNRDIAQEYEVMSIPTIIIFKNGEQVDRMVGVISKEDFRKAIKENL